MSIPVNGRFPCCPARPGQLLIPIEVPDPCLTDPGPVVTSLRTEIDFVVAPVECGVSSLDSCDLRTFFVDLSEPVTGVDTCDNPPAADPCPSCNVRVFKCPDNNSVCDPEVGGVQLTDYQVLYDGANLITINLPAFPTLNLATRFRIVIGDVPGCPIVDSCGKAIVPFRCDFFMACLN